MDYHVVECGNHKIVTLLDEGRMLNGEQDALDLIAFCAENGTNLLFIPGQKLSDNFLRLGTGIAGAIVQKFAMYSIKVAAMLDEQRIRGKFIDFMAESNKGNSFRVFGTFEDAAQWLLKP